MRMLMNNLDPEVAEHPDQLIVYGGSGRAARSWDAFDAIVGSLRDLAGDETLLVQSGKPVGVFRTHEWAPRVLIANSNLVPAVGDLGRVPAARVPRPDHVRPDDGRLVDLHRHPGHLAGHLRDVRGGGRQAVRRLAGRDDHADRRARRHGRRTAARGHDERRRRDLHRLRPGQHRAPDPVRLPRRARRRHRRRDPRGDRGRPGRPAAVDRPARQRRRPAARAAQDGRPDQRRHRPDLGARPADLPAAAASRSRTWPRCAPRTRPGSPGGRASPWPRTSRPWSASWTPAPRSSTTATRSGARPNSPATTVRSPSPASCPPTSGRCSARARARSAGPRCPATRPTSPRPTGRSSTCSPTTSRWPGGSGWPGEKVHFQGLPARICWLGYGERDKAGLRFNDLVARGEVKAPIVLGRDHLDCGSVASPYRETEGMADGSDAIADWPLLNALVNTASGASWVSIHHGGGVGIGRSIHAGQVCVADGTALAASKLERVLTQRPGHGRDPARRRRLRPGARGSHRARRPRPDARAAAVSEPAAWQLPLWQSLLPLGRSEQTGGYRRYAFTEADLSCRDWFLKAASSAIFGWRLIGTRTCGPGGTRRREPSPARDAGAVVTGSHLDSVPDGGAFDGPLGVVSAFVGYRPARASAGQVRCGRLAWSRSSRRRGLGSASACLGSKLLTGAIAADAAANSPMPTV